ncbi:MAG: DEAD/DEAH box helicase [Proteobacteria bacterium]|nr:DEAD/DEAH box helicase [Pseudomonadota bacterium]
MEELVNEAALEMGYSSIRDKQKEAILGFLSGRDVFVSLPTGSGKSLCYSILPKVFDRVRKTSGSIVIVVSPLVSLMKDQVHSLETKGIKSVFVTKDTAKDSESDDSSFEQQLYEGSFQVVFFSPEALLCNDTWRELLQTSVYQKNVVAFVIDEAHLVKKW